MRNIRKYFETRRNILTKSSPIYIYFLFNNVQIWLKIHHLEFRNYTPEWFKFQNCAFVFICFLFNVTLQVESMWYCILPTRWFFLPNTEWFLENSLLILYLNYNEIDQIIHSRSSPKHVLRAPSLFVCCCVPPTRTYTNHSEPWPKKTDVPFKNWSPQSTIHQTCWNKITSHIHISQPRTLACIKVWRGGGGCRDYSRESRGSRAVSYKPLTYIFI